MANFDDPKAAGGNVLMAAVLAPGTQQQSESEQQKDPIPPQPTPPANDGSGAPTNEDTGLSSLYDCNGPLENNTGAVEPDEGRLGDRVEFEAPDVETDPATVPAGDPKRVPDEKVS